MASGNTLLIFDAADGQPPSGNAATLDRRLGGSTPGEHFLVWDFDAAADEILDFRGILPQNYSGGGVTCRIWWGASTATTGNVIWNLAFRAMEDDADDIDVTHTYDVNAVTDAAPSASGEYTAAVITFTDGADMDSVGAGDLFVLRLRRDADNASDTMTGDAEFVALEIRET